MLFGICSGPENVDIIKNSGFDFFEINVQSNLTSLKSEDAFIPVLKKIKESPIPPIAANCFIPGSMKVCGENVNFDLLKDYVLTVFDRAKRAGVKIIVFGSGGARNVPQGFEKNKALDQIIKFCKMISTLAQDNDITVVLEPLNKKECNILNTIQECFYICDAVSHPSIQLLVDSYHFFLEKDNPEYIIKYADKIKHVHIATSLNRMAPGIEDCDFSGFVNALKKINYNLSVSIESSWNNMSVEAPKAKKELERLFVLST